MTDPIIPPSETELDAVSRDSRTLAFYSAEATNYAAGGTCDNGRHLYPFLDLLPAKARILELGCGAGRDAQAMMAAGFEVDPTDGTPAMAREAEERLGRPVRVMRFDELDAVGVYDAVWAYASLLHVPRQALPLILSLIFAALKPGGLHFASFKGGTVEGRDIYDRYYNYLSRQDVIEAYECSSPWEIVSIEEYSGGGYDGRQGPWIGMLVRKPA